MLEWSQQGADGQLLISARLCHVDYKINSPGSEPPIAPKITGSCSAALAVVIGRTLSP